MTLDECIVWLNLVYMAGDQDEYLACLRQARQLLETSEDNG